LDGAIDAPRARLGLLRCFNRLDMFALMRIAQRAPPFPRSRGLEGLDEVRRRRDVAFLRVQLESYFDRLATLQPRRLAVAFP
jgi:hypothetical protein